MNLIRHQQDYNNPNSLASKFRRARAKHVLSLIKTVFDEKGSCSIIDLGGRSQYWEIIDRKILKGYNVSITTINSEQQDHVNDPMFIQNKGNALAVDCDDNSYDLAHSNSVIEHVGDWAQMQVFAKETKRLAKRYFVQTPYFWFPIEPHFSSMFFHWTTQTMRAKALMKRDIGFCQRQDNFGEAMTIVEHARLLDKTKMKALFADAQHIDEAFLGLTKSLMAIRS